MSKTDTELVYNFMLKHFKGVNLDDVPFDITVLPQADAVIKHLAQHQAVELPILPKAVLKAIQKRLMDYITAQTLAELAPDYTPLEIPEDLSEQERLEFILSELIPSQPLLPI